MKLSVEKYYLFLANECMSTQELSEKSGVSQVTIRRLISRKQEARPQTIGKIAKALNVKVQDLLEQRKEVVT